jgi:hypothetical protein
LFRTARGRRQDGYAPSQDVARDDGLEPRSALGARARSSASSRSSPMVSRWMPRNPCARRTASGGAGCLGCSRTWWTSRW